MILEPARLFGACNRACHCSLFRPTPELLNFMKSGQPHQKYLANGKAKKEERERLERERRLRREIQVTGREKQLKAVQRMKNLQKKAGDCRNEKADEGRKGKGGVGWKGGE